MIGSVYNNLTIISTPVSKLIGGKKRKVVACKCVCGAEIESLLHSVVSGHTKSCGCIMLKFKDREKAAKIRISYNAMIARCTNPKHARYKNYGAKGIKISKEWSSFEAFYNDVEGTWQPGLTIDRLDSKGHYGKNNFRWATDEQQQRNRSNNKLSQESVDFIRSSGLTCVELAKMFNVRDSTISRVKNYIRWK